MGSKISSSAETFKFPDLKEVICTLMFPVDIQTFKYRGGYKKKRRSQRRNWIVPLLTWGLQKVCHAVQSSLLCLTAWQGKQYSTSIAVIYSWVETELISRYWTRDTWLLFFATEEHRRAFLEDDWCGIISWSFKIYHFMCIKWYLGHIDIFPPQHTLLLCLFLVSFIK